MQRIGGSSTCADCNDPLSTRRDEHQAQGSRTVRLPAWPSSAPSPKTPRQSARFPDAAVKAVRAGAVQPGVTAERLALVERGVRAETRTDPVELLAGDLVHVGNPVDGITGQLGAGSGELVQGGGQLPGAVVVGFHQTGDARQVLLAPHV